MSLTNLANLAMRYWVRGAYAKVLPLVARVAEIREAQLRRELARLAGLGKRALMMLLQQETDSIVSLQADAMPSSPRALELALTTVLRRKGRGLEEPESARNAASAEFRAQSEPITIAKIRAALPPGAALVEFVRYHRFDPRQAQPQQEARYVAYVLPWDGPAQAIALGEAAPIDAAVDDQIAAMYMGTGAGVARAALGGLDTLVFAPLRDPLANISHVFLALDDKLNLVPFEALAPPHSRHELERRLISYVTSGRDLLRPATHRAPRASATIVAAADHAPPSSGDFARSTGRAEALRRAKLQLLRQPRFAPLYSWAAFIPAGAWAPLGPDLLKR